MAEQKEEMLMQQNTIEQKVVTENFDQWNAALNSKDPKKVAEMYTEDATFLPTLSPKFKVGREETEEYFEHFLQKNPDGKVVQEKVQTLSPKSYLHSGMYNFIVDQDGDRRLVEARFTFLWEQDAHGVWKIAHHHSSVKPQ
ncbi:MAG: SgcJ/EcaC family oxidoreductase [Candidatus Parcubacteria bacterium]|nr:SgcJ/EcaC family oxidoreductase [Candidatus Parcubacteria bacterium]